MHALSSEPALYIISLLVLITCYEGAGISFIEMTEDQGKFCNLLTVIKLMNGEVFLIPELMPTLTVYCIALERGGQIWLTAHFCK